MRRMISFTVLVWLMAAPGWAGQMIFFPDPNTEVTSVDGYADYTFDGSTWATIYNAAGNAADDTGASTLDILIQEDVANPGTLWQRFRRAFTLFDTSPLPDSVVVTSAVLSVFGATKTNTMNCSDAQAGWAVTSGTPTSNTAIVAGDYALSHFGSTRFVDADVVYSAFSTSAYNNMTLNASGRAAISTTGISKFGHRLTADLDNAVPAGITRGVSLFCRLEAKQADTAGTSSDPMLTVNYESAVPIPPMIMQWYVPSPVPISRLATGPTEGLTDYKIWYIARDDYGAITDVAVRIFEGHLITHPVQELDGTTRLETVYQRTHRLTAQQTSYLGPGFISDGAHEARHYTAQDFGVIATSRQLQDFLDAQIQHDPWRTPIHEQARKRTDAAQ